MEPLNQTTVPLVNTTCPMCGRSPVYLCMYASNNGTTEIKLCEYCLYRLNCFNDAIVRSNDTDKK